MHAHMHACTHARMHTCIPTPIKPPTLIFPWSQSRRQLRHHGVETVVELLADLLARGCAKSLLRGLRRTRMSVGGWVECVFPCLHAMTIGC